MSFYYAYFESSVHRYYYFNATTNETVWTYPKDGVVIDPETNTIFQNPSLTKQNSEPKLNASGISNTPANNISGAPKVLQRRGTVLVPKPKPIQQTPQKADDDTTSELMKKLQQRLKKIEPENKDISKGNEPVKSGLPPPRETSPVKSKASLFETAKSPQSDFKQFKKELPKQRNSSKALGEEQASSRKPLSSLIATFEVEKQIQMPQPTHKTNQQKETHQAVKKETKVNEDVPLRPPPCARRNSSAKSFCKDSIRINMAEDGNPPLILEIDESIVNFDLITQAKKDAINKRRTMQFNELKNLKSPRPKSMNDYDEDEYMKLFEQACHEFENAEELRKKKLSEHHFDQNDVEKVKKELEEALGSFEFNQEEVQEKRENENIEIEDVHQPTTKDGGENGNAERRIYKPQVDETQTPYLPCDVKISAPTHRIKEFARDNFNNQRRGLFSKQSISLESLIEFSSEPLTAPLLNALPDKVSSSALKCFRLILKYVLQNEDEAAFMLVGRVYEQPQLVDEVYFQLVKQTSRCPDDSVEVRAWELFLIISTIFAPSNGTIIWIKAHIARAMASTNSAAAQLARFTYIRFTGRASIGVHMERSKVTDRFVREVPSHPRTSAQLFGCSIYEVMWNQRRFAPHCPVPFFLVQMCRAIIDRGGTRTEGVFRMPGSMRKVDETVRLADAGEEVLRGAALFDLCSLMKRWFRDMAEPIVSATDLPICADALRDETTIEFACALPTVKAMTLAYLVGFLQELAEHEDRTKMSAANLAMCFAPNVVAVAPPNMAMPDSHGADVGKSFLCELIVHWDVSWIYPFTM